MGGIEGFGYWRWYGGKVHKLGVVDFVGLGSKIWHEAVVWFLRNVLVYGLEPKSQSLAHGG